MSFTNDDILVLAKAGFTAQQIGALNSINVKTPIPTALATPLATPIPTASATSATSANNDTLSQILTAIQTNAINATEQPKPQTTDDILAEIINPPTK